MDETKRPYWFPDTQGFLAVAIIAVVAFIVTILLIMPPAIDERTSGVLMTIVGVLIACLKDVFSFFFGSSKGSERKDESQAKVIENVTRPPNGTGGGAAVAAAAEVAAEKVAPAAAEKAAPPAAEKAAAPAAEVAAPPAVDAALEKLGLTDPKKD